MEIEIVLAGRARFFTDMTEIWNKQRSFRQMSTIMITNERYRASGPGL